MPMNRGKLCGAGTPARLSCATRLKDWCSDLFGSDTAYRRTVVGILHRGALTCPFQHDEGAMDLYRNSIITITGRPKADDI